MVFWYSWGGRYVNWGPSMWHHCSCVLPVTVSGDDAVMVTCLVGNNSLSFLYNGGEWQSFCLCMHLCFNAFVLCELKNHNICWDSLHISWRLSLLKGVLCKAALFIIDHKVSLCYPWSPVILVIGRNRQIYSLRSKKLIITEGVNFCGAVLV